MRILQLTDFYRPVIGGLERHVETLAHQLAADGHHVAVATLAQPHAPDREVINEIDVYRLRGWHRALMPLYQAVERPFHPPVPDPGIMRSLMEIVRREQPDIIHAHGWIVHSLLPLLRGERPRAVVTLHDYGLVCPNKMLLRQGAHCAGPALWSCLACGCRHYGPIRGPALAAGMALSAPLYRGIDGYISVSTSVEAASRPRMHGSRSAIIPTLLPDAQFDAADTARPAFLPPEDGYLLFVGVLAPYKGIDVLLEAYQTLRDPPPLVIVGTPYGKTRARYPKGVTVHQNIAHEQVMAAWRHAGIAVVPSMWHEPLPSVLLEAMLSRKAIVASDVGGIPDCVRDGESAVLVRPGDSPALMEALQRLIDDRALRERLASAAFADAQLYRASRVAAAIAGLYRSLLSSSARSGGW